jgi:PKD repeat protein
MKKLLLLATSIAYAATSIAQLHCGHDEAMKALYDANPALKTKMEVRNANNRTTQASPKQVGNYTIPVVFHILHLGGAENISDAQVRDEMRVLNDNYAKRNADTINIIPAFKNIADSTGIHFVLATKDPNGNCTNGIVHYLDPDANWNTSSSSTLFTHKWPANKYMNVFVVKTISSGAAGYTYLPGTWATNAPEDAITILSNYVGSIGTSSPYTSKTLTHEVGHWLNLPHVFGNSNSPGPTAPCGDDFVFDTPITKGNNLVCPDASNPASYTICTPGVQENFQNYMDYSYCEIMFTKGQATRMRNALNSSISGRNNLWTASNLLATGVTTPQLCAPSPEFKADKKLVCVNKPINFTSQVANGVATSYAWTFTGGTPATSSNASQTVTYAATGMYTVTLTTSNAYGSNTISKTAYIKVIPTVASIPVADFRMDFEDTAYFNQNWTVLNNDNDSKKFQITKTTSFSGSQCLTINNFSKTSIVNDEVVFPALDFTGVTTATLKFRYAYIPTDQYNNDKLDLGMQTGCTGTFYSKFAKTANGGSSANTDLSTDYGNFDFNNYVATRGSSIEWKQVVLNNLSSSYGKDNVVLKFDFTPGAGNNLYIDDIEIITNLSTGIATTELLGNEFSVAPNPSQGLSFVNFTLTKASDVNINITNNLGQVVQMVTNKNMAQGEHSFEINTYKLAKGFYMIVLNSNGNKLVKKLIVE